MKDEEEDEKECQTGIDWRWEVSNDTQNAKCQFVINYEY